MTLTVGLWNLGLQVVCFPTIGLTGLALGAAGAARAPTSTPAEAPSGSAGGLASIALSRLPRALVLAPLLLGALLPGVALSRVTAVAILKHGLEATIQERGQDYVCDLAVEERLQRFIEDKPLILVLRRRPRH